MSSAYFDKRPLLGHQVGSLLSNALTGVCNSYADETGEAAEAAAAAEKQLAEGRPEDSTQSAAGALEAFRKAQNPAGATDALLAMINAQKMSADLSFAKPTQALKTVKGEQAAFNSKGDKRGVACMKLARAELNAHTSRQGVDIETALMEAEEAFDVFSDEGDTKMQAFAQLVLVNIYCKKKRGQDAQEAARSALELFSGLHDKAGQAKALHGKGLAFALLGDFATAVKNAQKAFELCTELGHKRDQAFELAAIAKWQLDQGKPHAAMEAAKKSFGLASVPRALVLVCEAAVASGRSSQAVRFASEALKKYKTTDNPLNVVSGMAVQIFSQCNSTSPLDAVDTAREAVRTAQGYGNKELELNLMYKVSEAHMKNNRYEAASKAMRDAASIARQLGDTVEEADALRQLAYLVTTMQDLGEDSVMLTEGIESAQSARALYNEIGFVSDEASAIMITSVLKSQQQQQQGNQEDGSQELLSLAKEALECYQKAADMSGEFEAAIMLVDLYIGANQLNEATSTASSAVELCRQSGQKKSQAEALKARANIQLINQDFDGATDSIQEAQSLCKEIGTKTLAATLANLLVQVNVGELTLDSEDQDTRLKALKAAEAGVLAAKQAGDKVYYGVALTWRAQVLTLADRGAEALQSIELAEKVFKQAGDVANQARSAVTIAELLHALGKKAEAKEAANTALGLTGGNPDLAEVEADARSVLSALVERKRGGGGGKRMVRKLVKKWRKKGGGGGGGKGGMSIDVLRPKLTTLVQNVLTDDGDVELDTPFMEAGIDSLGSVQLLTDVGKEFAMALAPSAVFDYPTIRDLGDHLVAEGAGGAKGGGGGGGEDEWEEYEDWEEVEEDYDGGDFIEAAAPVESTKQITMAASAAVETKKKGLDLAVVKPKVMNLVKNVLADEDDVFEDSPFMEAGIDSLGSVQLLTDVGKEFQIQLAPSAVFDYPSVRELADHLVATVN